MITTRTGTPGSGMSFQALPPAENSAPLGAPLGNDGQGVCTYGYYIAVMGSDCLYKQSVEVVSISRALAFIHRQMMLGNSCLVTCK